jgi:copper homeostasis protein
LHGSCSVSSREEISVSKVVIEVCCGSVDDAVEAERGGADRVEVNSAVFLGGLTPSMGSIIEAKKRLNIPLMVMIRPRAGGFCYTQNEMEVMLRDIKLAVEHYADGLVFGILTPDGSVDIERCKRIIELAQGRQTVFHRAFDVTPDPLKALDQLVGLGFSRILTSGQERTAPEGIELIKKLIVHAGNRIEILPGSGLRPHNVRAFVEQTKATQVHFSAFGRKFDSSMQHQPHITFNGTVLPPEDRYDLIDRNIVRDVCKRLNQDFD